MEGVQVISNDVCLSPFRKDMNWREGADTPSVYRKWRLGTRLANTLVTFNTVIAAY